MRRRNTNIKDGIPFHDNEANSSLSGDTSAEERLANNTITRWGIRLMLLLGFIGISLPFTKMIKMMVTPTKPKVPTYTYVELKRNDPPPTKPPRLMKSTDNPVFFLHIGKTGGTSMEILLGHKILRPMGRTYSRGMKHYDWSFIEQRGDPDTNADVATFLRDPVSRAVSQFHYSQTLMWAKEANASFIHQNLEEYLDNPGTFTQPINDGEAALDVMSGIFPDGTWVGTDGNEDSELKQFLRHNITENLKTAARNLDRTTWFGLLEDIPRSMEMLQWTLGLDELPEFPHHNSNSGNKHRRLKPYTKFRVKSFIPCEVWLYDYGKRLFEARWNYYKGQEYVHPEYPDSKQCQRSKQKLI